MVGGCAYGWRPPGDSLTADMAKNESCYNKYVSDAS